MANAAATFIQNPALEERLGSAVAWIALPEAEASPTAVRYKDSPYRAFWNMGMRYGVDNSSNCGFPITGSRVRPSTTTACRSFNDASNKMPPLLLCRADVPFLIQSLRVLPRM